MQSCPSADGIQQYFLSFPTACDSKMNSTLTHNDSFYILKYSGWKHTQKCDRQNVLEVKVPLVAFVFAYIRLRALGSRIFIAKALSKDRIGIAAMANGDTG